jgi:glycosyltransferase involved in cell wall biosynthesis
MSEIRVLHVATDPATVWLIIRSIAERQAKSGYTVEFACSQGEYLPLALTLGFPVCVIPFGRKFVSLSHVLAFYKLWRLMRQKKFHIVHTHTPIASFLGRIAAALARTPIVIYHMRGGLWGSGSLLEQALFTAAELSASCFTSHIFTINCADARDLVVRRIAPQRKVTCLHCGGGGVNLERFNALSIPEQAKTRLRAELGIEECPFVIGFVGRFVREKGIFELLSAFEQIVRLHPSARLVMVGDTLSSERDKASGERIRKIVKNSAQLSRKVVFTGFRADIPLLIAAMDVVVLPSYREGFGMVLAEAAAMGIPTITTETRGGREAVIADRNGFHVRIGDVVSLRDALLRLAGDPGLGRSMGEEGRRLASKRFDEQLVFKKIHAEYMRLLRAENLQVPHIG